MATTLPRFKVLLPALLMLTLIACSGPGAAAAVEVTRTTPGAIAGSASCRECHRTFHQKWETSRHGTTVTPVDANWIRAEIPAQPLPETQGGAATTLRKEGERLVAGVTASDGVRRSIPVDFALGGRDLWYLLGALNSERLQVLPLAWDRNRQEWFSPAQSAVRPHAAPTESAVAWDSEAYAFNASCFSCHVSGTVSLGSEPGANPKAWWAEPGIRCESCHGPAADHVRICRETASGSSPEDLRIVAISGFESAQINGLCGSCHAKRAALTPAFAPGDLFEDHYDLALLEDLDWTPDGRELGETYTMTSWLGNRCAQKGALHCLHCHTSSGRDRFPGESSNQSCAPCHADHVGDPEPHTHHRAGTPGGNCVDCHLPVSEFARMRRHDHSFRPPTPAVTLALGTSNACNDCHSDRDAAWADAEVRRWSDSDYQAPVVRRARWVQQARARDWSEAETMLRSVEAETDDVRYVASMIRLLGGWEDPRKLPVLRRALEHDSPWVQAAAAGGLEGHLGVLTLSPLVRLTQHPRRLVRVRAAAALAPVDQGLLNPGAQAAVERAFGELEQVWALRGEDPAALQALGHFRLDRGDAAGAVEAFERALARDPDDPVLLVNAGTAQFRQGSGVQAEAHYRRALEHHPGNATVWSAWVNFLTRCGRTQAAQEAERSAMRTLPVDQHDRFRQAVRSADRERQAR